jgi:hypothetical protein
MPGIVAARSLGFATNVVPGLFDKTLLDFDEGGSGLLLSSGSVASGGRLRARRGAPTTNLRPRLYPGHCTPYFSHLSHAGRASSHYNYQHS